MRRALLSPSPPLSRAFARRLVVVAALLAAAVAAAEWARPGPSRHGPGGAGRGTSDAASPAVAATEMRAPRLEWRSSSMLPAPPAAPSAHAAALTWRPGRGPGEPGRLLAVWWAGSRESGPDVRVYLSALGAAGWSAPRAVVDRESLGRSLGFAVRRIGNAVVHAAPDGRLHLFVVATGLGGWAAGRVAHLVAEHDDAPFVVQRVLPLTPLANTSVLVRAQPLGRPDGGWWLPAYFELGSKYPMLLEFAADGTLRSIVRVGRSTTSLQPTLLPLPGGRLLALMRDHGPSGRIQVAASDDGGARWRDEPPLALSSHDTAVAAAPVWRPGASPGEPPAGYVLVHNDTSAPGSTARSVLRLHASADGRHWEPGPDVQRGEAGAEFSYPNALQVGTQLHVVYTHRRQGIGHAVVEVSWPDDPGEGGAR